MKTKLVILILAVLFLSVPPAIADPFTLTPEAAMMLWGKSIDPDGSFYGRYPTPTGYGPSMLGEVGYVGTFDNEGDWADMMIAPDVAGVGGTSYTLDDVLSAALGTTISGGDISNLGLDEFNLIVSNDNEDIWWVNLYIEIDNGTPTESGWESLSEDETTLLTIDLTELDLTKVTDIGLMVGGNMTDLNGNPSNLDAFHISVVPLPAAVILGVLGLGVAGIKLRKYA